MQYPLSPQTSQFTALSTSSANDPQSAKLGVFDSGVGGLTVLRELYRQMPGESILYLGDTARLPYGTRSQAQIIAFVEEILEWMMQQHVKMVLMACNTSSALALDIVRSKYEIPMLGVILPGARAAVQGGKRIGVIATPATAASGAYRRAIQEIDPAASVWEVGCPEFVPLIEQNRLNDPYTKAIAEEYLAPLMEQEIDTLIYGCTHYPHLEPLLKTILPATVRLIDPAVHVVRSAAQEIDLLGLRNGRSPKPTEFWVSGSPESFAQRSVQWLGFTPVVQQVQMKIVGQPVSVERMD